jgi:chromosome segregation ATPase
MTLVFTKSGAPDMRAIEYDKAILKLVADKAEAESELGKVRAEIAEVGGRRVGILQDIEAAQKKFEDIMRDATRAMDTMTQDVIAMSEKQHIVSMAIEERVMELSLLEQRKSSLATSISIGQDTLASFSKRVDERAELLAEIKEKLGVILEERDVLEKDVLFLQDEKSRLGRDIEASEILLANMAKKEQFLNRKEEDLQKYEDRVKKQRLEVGNINPMNFQ